MNKKGLVVNSVLVCLFLYSVSISAAVQTYSFTAGQTISGNGTTGSCTTDGIAITPASTDPVFSAFYSNYATPSNFSTDKCYTHLVDGETGMGYSPVDGGKLMRLSANAPFNIQSIKVFPQFTPITAADEYIAVEVTHAPGGQTDFTQNHPVVANQWNTLTLNYTNVTQLDFHHPQYPAKEYYFQDFMAEKYVAPVINYYIFPSAGANVSIIPPNTQSVAAGTQDTFTVTPSANYTASVGGTCGGVLVGTTYTTAAVTANCTVEASAILNGSITIPPSVEGGTGEPVTYTVTSTTPSTLMVVQTTTTPPAPTDPIPASSLVGIIDIVSNSPGNNGYSTVVTFNISNSSSSIFTGYWKYGPESGGADHWYDYGTLAANGNGTGYEISNGGKTIKIYLTDGVRGDDDLLANASITDPALPIIKTAPPVFTDSFESDK